jgi:hypothetical protein
MYSFSAWLARCMMAVLSIMTLAACQIRGAYPTKEPNMKESSIQLKLTAEPLQFSMAERQGFKLTIAATNRGNQVVDPELHRVLLFVNGQESMVWNEAIGNGRREDKWFALPPGDTVSMTWSSMGPFLFTAPGEYMLAAHYGDTQLEPIQIHVLAK